MTRKNEFQDQTIMSASGTLGNCFQAALATVLDKKIEAVPHFALLGMMHALSCCVAWLNAEGYETDTRSNDMDGLTPLPLCIIRGTSPRGIGHAVVGDTATGEMVHDPHPSREGLVEINSRLYIFQQPAITDSVRLAFLHTHNRDAEGYEYGICKVKFDAFGQLASGPFWTASDHSDIDARITLTQQAREAAEAPHALNEK